VIRHADKLDSWRAAGLTDPESDALDRPFPSFGIVVSEQVKLDVKHDRLLWNRWPGRLVPVPPDLLARFVALGVGHEGRPCEPTGEAILAFARAYGPLGAWPVHMLERFGAEPAFREMKRSLPDGFSMGEPLAHWRYAVAAMRAVLDLVALTRDGKAPTRESWGPLGTKEPSYLDWCIRGKDDDPLSSVCGTLNSWMEVGGVRPRIFRHLDDRDGEVRANIHAHTMFGVLAVQLLQAVSSTSGWALCKSCGIPFAVPIGGRGRRSTYCTRCGPQARRPLAARRYYYKSRERKKAHGKASRKKASSRKPRR
jgi:hypothetical protein